MNSRVKCALIGLMLSLAAACGENTPPAHYGLLITGGTVYDGSGTPGMVADVAVEGDKIVAIGDLSGATADQVIDAAGLAVSPGFINMLSWGVETLIEDGRALSDIMQGVTLEVFGEGTSWGPLSEKMKAVFKARQGDIRYDITWTSLGDYLEFLENKGVSVNVASFMGATSARMHVLGQAYRSPTPQELLEMTDLVRAAMEDGAMGVGSSLIYAPAFFADTDELIALVGAAAEYGGSYISHMRSEGDKFEEAVEELITIARATGAPAEIYHLKAAGEANWSKLENVFTMIEDARADGLNIRANMYTYTAGATGLDAAMPPWVQAGGYEAWAQRLRDPEIRARVIAEMRAPATDWESLMQAAGSPQRMLLLGFKNPELKPLTGKTLAEVAAMRGVSPEDAVIDLVIEDGSRVGTAYFIMDEANIRAKIAKPYVTFGSDAGTPAPEGVFIKSSTHPRAYGNFARLLGKYVRDEQVISLAEAIKRLTSQSAANLGIAGRGQLAPGYFADIAIFDPDTIADRATFDQPHQLAVGIRHVIVNGDIVVSEGEHTGVTPGRVVRGPGWRGWKDQTPID